MARKYEYVLDTEFGLVTEGNVPESKPLKPDFQAVPLNFKVPETRPGEPSSLRGVFLSETGEAILISYGDSCSMKCAVPLLDRAAATSLPNSAVFKNINILAERLNEATRSKTIKQECCREHASTEDTVHVDLTTNTARIKSANAFKHPRRFSSVEGKCLQGNAYLKSKRKSLPIEESYNYEKFRSSSKFSKKYRYPKESPIYGKRRNYTRLGFGNQLKVVNASYSPDFRDAFSRAMADCFHNALRSGLFMHQSQLESFIRLVQGSSSINGSSNIQVIEQLQDILTRLVPCSSSCNFLVEMLNCFLKASDAVSTNRFRQYNNLKDAADVIGKLKIIHSSIKNTAFIKNFMQKTRSNIPNFLSNRQMFTEFCRTAMPKYDTNLTWKFLRPIFEDELCEADSRIMQRILCQILQTRTSQPFLNRRAFRTDNFECIDNVSGDNSNNNDLSFEIADFQASVDYSSFPLKPTNRYCICQVDLTGHSRDSAKTCDYCKVKFSGGELFIMHNKKYVPADCKFDNDYSMERMSNCSSPSQPPSVLSLEKSRSINDYLGLVDMIDSVNHQDVVNEAIFDFDVERTFETRDKEDLGRSENLDEIFDWRLSKLDSILVTPTKKSKTDDESEWSENNDRCLLEELHKFSGDLIRASIEAAHVLNVDIHVVQRRMEMLVEMLENSED